MMASLPHGEYVRGPNQQPRRVCVLPAPVTPGVARVRSVAHLSPDRRFESGQRGFTR